MLSGRNFSYSAQVVFVLFASSHSIMWRHQFRGYKIEKRYIFIIDTKKWTLNSFANQTQRYSKANTCSYEKYWLNIKKSG